MLILVDAWPFENGKRLCVRYVKGRDRRLRGLSD